MRQTELYSIVSYVACKHVTSVRGILTCCLQKTGLGAGLKVCGCYSVLTSLEQLFCCMRNATATLTLTKGLVQQSKYCHTHKCAHKHTYVSARLHKHTL